ncbi:MAG: RNA polymerase sigma factor [Phycisphaerae bacterium]
MLFQGDIESRAADGNPPLPPAPMKHADLLAVFQAAARGLYRYVVVRLDHDHAAADDLMQQLWLEISRDAGSGISAAGDAEAWMRGVARNLVRRYWRTLTRPGRGRPMADAAIAAELAEVLDREELPSEFLQRSETREQILLALTLLPADDQDLLIRTHFRGERQDDIARELNITVRAVEGRLYRARRAMRDLLSHLDPNEAS